RVALCSLPMLGEDLDAPMNRRIVVYNTAIREIAAEEQVAYLPVYESLTRTLAAAPGRRRAFTMDAGMMLVAVLRRYLLGQSFDDVAAANGFHLLADAVHLNERAGELVAA